MKNRVQGKIRIFVMYVTGVQFAGEYYLYSKKRIRFAACFYTRVQIDTCTRI